jgi:hypothetical protein
MLANTGSCQDTSFAVTFVEGEDCNARYISPTLPLRVSFPLHTIPYLPLPLLLFPSYRIAGLQHFGLAWGLYLCPRCDSDLQALNSALWKFGLENSLSRTTPGNLAGFDYCIQLCFFTAICIVIILHYYYCYYIYLVFILVLFLFSCHLVPCTTHLDPCWPLG